MEMFLLIIEGKYDSECVNQWGNPYLYLINKKKNHEKENNKIDREGFEKSC